MIIKLSYSAFSIFSNVREVNLVYPKHNGSKKFLNDKNYLALNFLITVVGFSIYESYYISEQKTKYIDVYRIFANEYIKRINENKTLQKCSFLMKVKNYIINAK